MPPFPPLPAKAAYLHLSNTPRRNALSLSVLRSLRTQLQTHLTSPHSGRLLTLPPFLPKNLSALERGSPELQWLLDADTWRKERAGLPNVIVLRSEGPVFSSGHDLKELRTLSHEEVKEAFALCAQVMGLIRQSPAIVVGAIQGLATAAGAQLALTTDIPIAVRGTKFQLPGAGIGLPCTSPVTAVSRRVNSGMAFRMLALAEAVEADELGGAVDLVESEGAFEERIAGVVEQLAERTGGMSSALGKWAFWTQLALRGSRQDEGGDGYGEAAVWAGRVMALHARTEDAQRGMDAFLGKKAPEFKT